MNNISTKINISDYRTLITRTIFLFFFITLLWRLYSYNLPYQLANPSLLKIGLDPNQWLYMMFNLQYWLVENTFTSYLFSYSLIALSLAIIFKPERRFLIILFAFLYYIYGILFNINLTANTHFTSVMMLLPLCFFPKKDKNFGLLWEFARYYACWIYGSAFLWKFIHGAAFQSEQGFEIMKSELAWFIYQNPEHLLTTVYTFFLANNFLLTIGTKIIYGLEGLFIIGFFTKKIDLFLAFSVLFIHITLYFFTDTLFIEQCILVFTFLSVKHWQKIYLATNKLMARTEALKSI